MKKFVTGLPLTQREREKDAAQKRDALHRDLARKKARRSSQRYGTPATPGHRRIYNRMVGSE